MDTVPIPPPLWMINDPPPALPLAEYQASSFINSAGNEDETPDHTASLQSMQSNGAKTWNGVEPDSPIAPEVHRYLGYEYKIHRLPRGEGQPPDIITTSTGEKHDFPVSFRSIHGMEAF